MPRRNKLRASGVEKGRLIVSGSMMRDGAPRESFKVQGYSSARVALYNTAVAGSLSNQYYLGNVNGLSNDLYAVLGANSEYGISSDCCTSIAIKRVRVSYMYEAAAGSIWGYIAAGYVADPRVVSATATESEVLRMRVRGEARLTSTTDSTVLLDFDPRIDAPFKRLYSSDQETARPIEMSAYGTLAIVSGNNAGADTQLASVMFEVWFEGVGMRAGYYISVTRALPPAGQKVDATQYDGEKGFHEISVVPASLPDDQLERVLSQLLKKQAAVAISTNK
jgi:hypothetical protein